MTRQQFIKRTPIFAAAALVGFYFLTVMWNAAIEFYDPKLRLRSSSPLAGLNTAAPEVEYSVASFISGDLQRKLTTRFSRRLFPFSMSVRLKNQFLYSVFREAGPPDIVVGAGDQLFETVYIDAFCDRTPLAANEIETWATRIAEIQNALLTRNIRFTYIMSPSKAAYYPEFLPTRLTCRAAPSKDRDDLSPYRAMLDLHGVHYVDGPRLLAERKGEFAQIGLFPRGGTHWNEIGAGLALHELTSLLETKQQGSPIGIYDFKWSRAPAPVREDRDLLDLLNLAAPNDDYPTPRISKQASGACGKAPKVVVVGSSFLREINVNLSNSACPPRIEYWFYMRIRPRVYELRRFRSAPGDESNGDVMPVSDSAFKEELRGADMVILEENEREIATTRQIGDTLAAIESDRLRQATSAGSQ